MRQGSRRWKMAAVAAGAAIALAACGSSGPGESSESGATAWALTGQEATFETSFDSWGDEHPDQSIGLEFFENDAYKQKIRTAIGSGSGPTLIFGWGGGILRSYVEADRVVPLDSDISKRYFPAVADNGRVDGKTYAVPNNAVQPIVLYYNQDVLDKADIDGPPKTWDELLDDVKALNDAGVAPFSIGGQSKWPQLMWLEYLTDRIGGPQVFENILSGEPDAWSQPAVIKANTMIQELVEAGGFIDGFASVTTDNEADLALLHTGKAAMILQGSWAYPNFKEAEPEKVADGTIAATTFPEVEGGKGDPAAVVGNPANFWSVSADADKDAQEAAKHYLEKGVLNEEYVQGLIDGGGVPPVKGLEDEIAKSDDADFLSFVYDLSRDAPTFQLSWDQALTPKQAQALLTNLEKVFLQTMTPEEFSEAMNKTITS